ncbi:MAG: hypothetical protein KGI27_09850 [Thaumarchaeota archaeon]|nr:hypothetical protein [Nitrososphaerota archaeon]
MNDLLVKLAGAIATAEGYFAPNSVPARDNNPGDLRAAPWLPAAKIVRNFTVFSSPAQGIGGLYHQLALDIARGDTLRQLVYRWAPPEDGNNTENYLKETARRVGIEVLNPPVKGKGLDQPLQELLELCHIP